MSTIVGVIEYKALNLKKIPGMTLETTLNKYGVDGWRVVAQVDNYVVLMRERD